MTNTMTKNHEAFQIKRLGHQEATIARELVLLFQEVFEMESPATAPTTYLNKLLKRPDFIVYVAMHDHEVVGGLTAYVLPMIYGEYAEVIIYDIAIKPAYQRKGLGKQLLSALNAYCGQHGIRDVFVDAHEEDVHAVDFYHAAGGKADKVIQFTFDINY